MKPVIGLSVSPWDYHLVFSAVFLSQNTSYTRVLLWLRRIGGLVEEWRISRLREEARRLGSYQVRRLPDALRLLPHALHSTSIWEQRARLVSIPWVGVKVAHATILFTSFSGYPIPVDRHLLRVVEGEPPRPGYCRRYPCPKCRFRERCIAWILFQKYRHAAGLYQTYAWLRSQSTRAISRLLLASQLPRNPPDAAAGIKVY